MAQNVTGTSYICSHTCDGWTGEASTFLLSSSKQSPKHAPKHTNNIVGKGSGFCCSMVVFGEKHVTVEEKWQERPQWKKPEGVVQ